MQTIPKEVFTQTKLPVFVEHAVKQDTSGGDRHYRKKFKELMENL